MLTTLADIKNDILVKLNVSTTVAFYTDKTFDTWIQEAYMWAGSFHKWPCTEVKDTSLTFSQSTETYPYPTGIKTNSVRMLTILQSGINYNLSKTLFKDYLNFRELTPTASDRIFTDWGKTLYINPSCDVVGNVTLYGQSSTVLTLNYDQNATNQGILDPTQITVFSNYDEEGNEALAYEVMSYAMMRERKISADKKGKPAGEYIAYHSRAVEILEGIWKRITDEQPGYLPKDSEMWKRFDVLTGRPVQSFSDIEDLSNRWF